MKYSENSTLGIIRSVVLKENSIENLFVHRFPDSLSIQNRIAIGAIEEQQITSALLNRDQLRLPFWDAIMLTFSDSENYSKEILKSVLYHNDRRAKVSIDRQRFLSDEFLVAMSEGENYALNSLVLTTRHEEAMHFLMLDFHIQENAKNKNVVLDVLKCLDVKSGFLLRSGKSYHFLSDYLVSEQKMIDFLAKAILFSPIIDKMWIAHQLIDRSCALRITKKNDEYPQLIEKVSLI